MLKINDDNSIELTRGDTAYLNVAIVDDTTGQAYEIAATDVLVFSVKKAMSDTTYCFQKTLTGTSIFKILPTDTKNLEYGKYKYDIQLTQGSTTDVYTIVPPSNLKLCQEVTRD